MTDTVALTPQDLAALAALGISAEEAHRQLALLTQPPPATHVLRPCRLGDGLRALAPGDEPRLLARYAEAAAAGRFGKVIPASGAATRMFAKLLAALEAAQEEPEPEAARQLAQSIESFAFAPALAEVLERQGHRLGELCAGDAASRRKVLQALLTAEGLEYASRPKGLLAFHRHPEGFRTPIEEHLLEAAALAAGTGPGRPFRVHFTVSPEEEGRFRERLAEVQEALERATGVTFAVTFSHQSRATDTLAVDDQGCPFRLADGTLLLRPSGHGALLENLSALVREGWDLAFLKNIDNVLPEARQGVVVHWKKLLGGLLVELEEKAQRLWQALTAGPPGAAATDEALAFATEELGRPLPARIDAGSSEAVHAHLVETLSRPLRVCGMVKNEGEPGGGPFWVEAHGEVSPQIVEASQLDLSRPDQKEALAAATHFNPVDLAVALRGRHGQPHDLARYVDPATAFVSQKTHEGRPLKALERPGLWNGAMAGWNTVFVEVPAATFAPVKTVFDLLRPEHQG